MRLKLIGCEIFTRELCAAAARSPHRVDIEFLPKALHDLGAPRMQSRLGEAVYAVDEADYDAIVLGYALCGNGLVGLRARTIPLVLPRAHDCITLFLGSRERYARVMTENPGTYFKTTGWIERGENIDQLGGQVLPGWGGPATEMLSGNPSASHIGLRSGPVYRDTLLGGDYDALVRKYGEDNARFLIEELGDLTRNYTRLTYISMGVGPDESYRRRTQNEATRRGLEYTHLEGDMSLLQRLVDGHWEGEDFLVVEPGHQVVARYSDEIVASEMSSEKTPVDAALAASPSVAKNAAAVPDDE